MDYIAEIDRIIKLVKENNQKNNAEILSRLFAIKFKLEETLIENLKFSVRTYSALKRRGIKTLEELLLYSKEEILKFRNIGNGCLAEIETIVKELGYSLRND